MTDGYYWIRHHDGTQFIGLYQGGQWWLPGVGNPCLVGPETVLWPVVQPALPGSVPLEVDHRIN